MHGDGNHRWQPGSFFVLEKFLPIMRSLQKPLSVPEAEADGCPGDNEGFRRDGGGHQKRIKRRKCVGIFLKVSGRASMTTAHMTMKSGVKKRKCLFRAASLTKPSPVLIHHWLLLWKCHASLRAACQWDHRGFDLL